MQQNTMYSIPITQVRSNTQTGVFHQLCRAIVAQTCENLNYKCWYVVLNSFRDDWFRLRSPIKLFLEPWCKIDSINLKLYYLTPNQYLTNVLSLQLSPDIDPNLILDLLQITTSWLAKPASSMTNIDLLWGNNTYHCVNVETY